MDKYNKYEMDIWFNILFGYYEKSNQLLSEFQMISKEGLGGIPIQCKPTICFQVITH